MEKNKLEIKYLKKNNNNISQDNIQNNLSNISENNIETNTSENNIETNTSENSEDTHDILLTPDSFKMPDLSSLPNINLSLEDILDIPLPEVNGYTNETINKFPLFSKLSELPEMPQFTELPELLELPEMPQFTELPEIPKMPELSNLSEF